MLPRALRMRSAGDFRSTTRSGRRFSQPLCVVYVRVEPGATDRRIGIVAAKTVGNSVARHRVARRVRAVVQQEAESLPAGSRVVVRALPGSADSPETADQLRRALTQAVQALA